MIDEVIALATVKTPRYASGLLRDRPLVQHAIALAEATLTAGRLFHFAMAEEIWAAATAGQQLQPIQRTRTRLAATHAAHSAAQAVEIVRGVTGTSAIFLDSPLERYVRDVHVVPTHIQLQLATYEAIGRLLVGLESNSPMF
jgi:alkylation response protein AidB-like acyl-CoA dehydrogenase